jgi:hypothetical protein
MTLNLASGVVDVVLVYFIGRRAFGRTGFAAVAALTLATTPAHVLHSGMPAGSLPLVPCILGWLLCLIGVAREDQTLRIALGTFLLGLAAYASPGALVTIPACLAITFGVLGHLGMRSVSPYLAAASGCVVALAPYVGWNALHPEAIAEQIQGHALYDTARLNPLQGARELASYVSLTERSSVYWDYFSPAFLFFNGSAGPSGGGPRAAVFLWPVIVLLPIGLYRLVAAPPSPCSLLLVLGLLVSPLAAALGAERFRIDRALMMLPYVALVSTAGVDALWSMRHKVWRAHGPHAEPGRSHTRP